MAFEKRKLDITDRVIGKFREGKLNLYLENEKIGQQISENNYDLEIGYEFTENRFYKFADVLSGSDQKYVDCDDEHGWC